MSLTNYCALLSPRDWLDLNLIDFGDFAPQLLALGEVSADLLKLVREVIGSNNFRRHNFARRRPLIAPSWSEASPPNGLMVDD